MPGFFPDPGPLFTPYTGTVPRALEAAAPIQRNKLMEAQLFGEAGKQLGSAAGSLFGKSTEERLKGQEKAKTEGRLGAEFEDYKNRLAESIKVRKSMLEESYRLSGIPDQDIALKVAQDVAAEYREPLLRLNQIEAQTGAIKAGTTATEVGTELTREQTAHLKRMSPEQLENLKLEGILTVEQLEDHRRGRAFRQKMELKQLDALDQQIEASKVAIEGAKAGNEFQNLKNSMLKTEKGIAEKYGMKMADLGVERAEAEIKAIGDQIRLSGDQNRIRALDTVVSTEIQAARTEVEEIGQKLTVYAKALEGVTDETASREILDEMRDLLESSVRGRLRNATSFAALLLQERGGGPQGGADATGAGVEEGFRKLGINFVQPAGGAAALPSGNTAPAAGQQNGSNAGASALPDLLRSRIQALSTRYEVSDRLKKVVERAALILESGDPEVKRIYEMLVQDVASGVDRKEAVAKAAKEGAKIRKFLRSDKDVVDAGTLADVARFLE